MQAPVQATGASKSPSFTAAAPNPVPIYTLCTTLRSGGRLSHSRFCLAGPTACRSVAGLVIFIGIVVVEVVLVLLFAVAVLVNTLFIFFVLVRIVEFFVLLINVVGRIGARLGRTPLLRRREHDRVGPLRRLDGRGLDRAVAAHFGPLLQA